MRSNRSRDTQPELLLRRRLHALGLRYRVCARPLPQIRRTVDIVFTRARVAVEVRGCFWHGCPLHYKQPATNTTYWAAKIARNRARDLDTEDVLDRAGWQLLVIWEHDDLEWAVSFVAETVRDR